MRWTRGNAVAHACIGALVVRGIGRPWWFLRLKGVAWVCLASYGLRYTTFFGGDGRHAIEFFNPWLARVRVLARAVDVR